MARHTPTTAPVTTAAPETPIFKTMSAPPTTPTPAPAPTPQSDYDSLPIEEDCMPTADVSDLRDVVDAINRLCATMKTSYDVPDEDDLEPTHEDDAKPAHVNERIVEPICKEERLVQPTSRHESLVEPIPGFFIKSTHEIECLGKATRVDEHHIEQTRNEERLIEPIREDESIVEPTHDDRFIERIRDEELFETQEDECPVEALRVEQTNEDECLVEPREVIFKKVEILVTERWSDSTGEPETEPSETYYTASSEASLVSDAEEWARVAAGHVAALRERFESMTRANTPCPEHARDSSPAFTASPDGADKS